MDEERIFGEEERGLSGSEPDTGTSDSAETPGSGPSQDPDMSGFTQEHVPELHFDTDSEEGSAPAYEPDLQFGTDTGSGDDISGAETGSGADSFETDAGTGSFGTDTGSDSFGTDTGADSFGADTGADSFGTDTGAEDTGSGTGVFGTDAAQDEPQPQPQPSSFDYDDEPRFDTQTGERLDKPKKKFPGILLTLAVTAFAVGCFVYAVMPGRITRKDAAGDADPVETEQAELAIASEQTEQAATEADTEEAVLSAAVAQTEALTEAQTENHAAEETEAGTETETETKQELPLLPPFEGGSVALSASLDVSDMVEEVMPSVVSVTSTNVQTVLDFFYGRRQIESTAAGSGFIVYEDADSYGIVTDASILSGAMEVTAGFFIPEESKEDSAGEPLAEAQIVGVDPETGLALLRVEKDALSEEVKNAVRPAVLGDSDAVRVGERAIAIGNALGYGQSVTEGIISAIGRQMQTDSGLHEFLQTDASINYGNYGGALLNEAGEVIGINAGKVSGESSERMGFAVPVNDAKQVIEALEKEGFSPSGEAKETEQKAVLAIRSEEPETEETKAEETQAEETQAGEPQTEQPQTEKTASAPGEGGGMLGVHVSEISEENQVIYRIPSGVYVADVTAGSGAEAAGLEAGDLITSVDGKATGNVQELKEALSATKAGDTAEVVYVRPDKDGKYDESAAVSVKVTLQ